MEKLTFVDGLDKSIIKIKTAANLKRIGELQYQMYAESKHSLLIVLQGMDGSGKDGLVKSLLENCNPVGISVKSFKKPTPEEYSHDFLWRIHQHTPPKGRIQVFIRSHYEDILVPSVEKIFPDEIIEDRYQLINEFEKTIIHNGTRILKFFMNVSFAEQENRLKERITNPEKHWKHNDGDWETRKKFDTYMVVYDKIFEKCNEVKWFDIPSDSNWQKTYFASEIVLKELEEMKIQWPPLKSEVYS